MQVTKKNDSEMDWEQLAELFEQCRSLSPEALEQFFSRVSVSDPQLLTPLKELLTSKAQVNQFMRDEPGAKLRAALESTLSRPKEIGRPQFEPRRIGKYVLTKRLGVGGMGEVYRALQKGDGGFQKQVAIKKISPQFLDDAGFKQMFEKEARFSSHLSHANLVQVFDFASSPEGELLVMEFVDGVNLNQLRDRLQTRTEGMPYVLSAFICAEICKGLHYAHTLVNEAGAPLLLIHRDISPQNIMVRYDGAVKLVDFGIMKAASVKTTTGLIAGKYAYMSPEQATGKELDCRSDIYALGLVLYELVTTHHAIQGQTDMEQLRAAQAGTVLPAINANPDLPAKLDEILSKCLGFTPEMRYSSAHDLYQALVAFLHAEAPYLSQQDLANFMGERFQTEIEESRRHGANPPLLAAKDLAPTVPTRPPLLIEAPPEKKSVVPAFIFALLIAGIGLFSWKQLVSKEQAKVTASREVETKNTTNTAASEASQSDPTTAPIPAAAPVSVYSPPDSSSENLVLRLVRGRNSRASSMTVDWTDANGRTGKITDCRISMTATCPPYTISGKPPFTFTVTPFVGHANDPAFFFSESTCQALAPSARYLPESGGCTLSLRGGETTLNLVFIKR